MVAYSREYTNSTSTKGEGKKKIAESQMKERGSGLKPNGICVENPLENDLPATPCVPSLPGHLPERVYQS